MKASYQVSERRACTALRLPQSTIRYKSTADPQTALRMRLRDLAVARVGLPKDFSVHSLRHTTAIMMAARGTSPIRIKTWLRHKRVSSSERYFEQVRFSDTGKKLEGIFGDLL
jgi:integrase